MRLHYYNLKFPLRKATIMLLLSILLTTLGCPSRLELEQRTLDHDGIQRTYWVHAPAAAPTTGAAMVLALHGGGGDGQKMARMTDFNLVSDAHGFVAVYPDGVSNRWNDGRTAPGVADVDDVGFLTALIDAAAAEFAVDPKRVYITGASNGGMMAFRMACERSNRLAAIAPVMASLPVEWSDACAPAEPLSVLHIHGTEDPLVPYDGGEIIIVRRSHGRVIPVEDTIAFWVRSNGCNTEPEIDTLPDIDPSDGTSIKRYTYTGGLNGTEVVFYKVEGGGHTWPGGEQYLAEWIIGKTSHDMDASAVIWDFFVSHPKE